MPRYYFHIQTPIGRKPDDDGLEFTSLEDAILDARRSGRAMVADEPDDTAVEVVSRCSFEISDESGRVVAKVPFIGNDA
jgi:hypothetical protein